MATSLSSDAFAVQLGPFALVQRPPNLEAGREGPVFLTVVCCCFSSSCFKTSGSGEANRASRFAQALCEFFGLFARSLLS